jgi:hemolysin D
MATNHKQHELEFLPAALEIQETPPSPIGRTITWSIVILFTITVAWACIGKVDIVAVAHGKVVPSGRTKVIQPLEIGTVRTIHVREGQAVNKGDPLVELDTTSTEADEKRIEEEVLLAEMEQIRSSTLIEAVNGQKADSILEISWPANTSPETTVTQKQLLQGQWQEFRARMNSLGNEQARRQAELATTDEVIIKLENTLPLVTERAESLKSLSEKQLAPRDKYLEIEQLRIEQLQDLAAQRKHREELKATLAQLKEDQNAYKAEFTNKILAQQAEAERKLNGLQQELVKARKRTWLQRLTAPVDGVVQQLAVHTIGGVVTPAQQLMVIVPQEEGIEVEAVIENKDIGFVREGQTAEVKVDAFPFTKYGVIEAELLNVSNDAVPDEKLGLIYTSRILLKQSAIQVGEKLINLSPGMSVTVEVKTGKRKLIEYIFSPLMQYVSESVRER